MQAIAALSSAASALAAAAKTKKKGKNVAKTRKKKGKTKLTSPSPGISDTLVLSGGPQRRNRSMPIPAAVSMDFTSISSGAFRNRIFKIPNVRNMVCSLYTTATPTLAFGTLAAGSGTQIIDLNPLQNWGAGNFAPFGLAMYLLAIAFRMFRITRLTVRYYGAGTTANTQICGIAYDPDAAVTQTSYGSLSSLQDSKFFAPYASTPVVMHCTQVNTGWKYIYNVSSGADDERWQSSGSLLAYGLANVASQQYGMIELDYDIEFSGLGREDLLQSSDAPPAVRNDSSESKAALMALYRFDKETKLLSSKADPPPAAVPSTASESSSSSSSIPSSVDEPPTPELHYLPSKGEFVVIKAPKGLTYEDRTR